MARASFGTWGAIACFIAACGADDASTMDAIQAGTGAVTGGSSGGAATGGSGGMSAAAGQGGTFGGQGGLSGGSGGAAAAAGAAGTMAGTGGTMAETGGAMAEAGSDGDSGTAGGGGAAGATDGPDSDAPCTASVMASASPSGSGPHDVVVETNSDPGIDEGTIYRPADLGGAERYPIFIWGEGGCSLDGLSNQSANAEIASHGYFVIADGTPSGGGGRSLGGPDAGAPMIAYIDWAIEENNKPCSAYYHSLDITKVATNGFSCGGLMAQGTAADPRLTTWMITSSGGFGANQALYDATHGPVLIVLGGPSDIAYENGKRDYENLAQLTYPIMLFSKDIGHGGDLFSRNGGDFTKLNLAWLNWWLKGDETATGKGFLVGDGCTLCEDSSWETASANIP